MGYSHVDWALLLKNFSSIRRLVVERDVGTEFFHKLNLFLRSSRGNDFQTIKFRELDYEPTRDGVRQGLT
jgi:hypothetical protein